LEAPGRLRHSEWIYVGFFFYTALFSFFLPLGAGTRLGLAMIAASVAIIFTVLSRRRFSMVRDWLPLCLTLLAYREMDWFTPAYKDHHFERTWIVWDRVILHDWRVQNVIESLGPLLPGYLELCYLLVYAVGFYGIAVLYLVHKRERVDAFVCVYALSGLLCYAMFPFFPSDPPRTVFPTTDLPNIVTPIRSLNLWLVNGAGIHSSVFPSAHVSTGFAAAWALTHLLPERPWFGRGLMIYAISMSIATVYGRYHYAVDAIAGFAVSVVAIATVAGLRLMPPSSGLPRRLSSRE
jgi:membrane-associated phospholipid phosphatase